PDQVAVRSIQRLNNRARIYDVHDTAVNDRDSFGLPGAHSALPGQSKLRNVLLVDLVERTEPLPVVSPAEHQPIIRTWTLEHLLGHRRETRQLCNCKDGNDRQSLFDHALQYTTLIDTNNFVSIRYVVARL